MRGLDGLVQLAWMEGLEGLVHLACTEGLEGLVQLAWTYGVEDFVQLALMTWLEGFVQLAWMEGLEDLLLDQMGGMDAMLESFGSLLLGGRGGTWNGSATRIICHLVSALKETITNLYLKVIPHMFGCLRV